MERLGRGGARLQLLPRRFGFILCVFQVFLDARLHSVDVANAVLEMFRRLRGVFLDLLGHQRRFRLQHFGIRSHLCLHLFAAHADVTNTVLQFFTGGFGVGFELSDIRFQFCGGFGHQIAVIRFVVAAEHTGRIISATRRGFRDARLTVRNARVDVVLRRFDFRMRFFNLRVCAGLKLVGRTGALGKLIHARGDAIRHRGLHHFHFRFCHRLVRFQLGFRFGLSICGTSGDVRGARLPILTRRNGVRLGVFKRALRVPPDVFDVLLGAEFQLRAWRRQRGDARRWIGLRQAAEALRRGSRAFLQVRGRLREVVVRLCFRFLEAVFDIRCAHLNIRAGLCGGVFDVLRGLRGIVLRFLRARFDVADALLRRFDRVFRRFFCFSFPQLRLDFRQRRIRLHLIDGFIPARFHVFCTLLHVLCRLFRFLLRFRHGALQIFNRVLGGVFDRIRRIFRRI